MPLHAGHQVRGDFPLARHPKNIAAGFAQQGCDLICIDKRFEICMHLLSPSEISRWMEMGGIMLLEFDSEVLLILPSCEQF
jgi:hypothetical protein